MNTQDTKQELKKVFLPDIISANTYFWHPNGAAAGRRANEERRQDEVKSFLKKLGFHVEQDGDTVIGTLGNLKVKFHYSESARNVYKWFQVFRNGRKSNIKGFISEMKKRGFDIIK